ncbi:carboxypeptidase regulatory-like domain-containing protein [Oerskovia sp. Sa2CUA9]|uniref:Carboxypeptidase regulatory-like domain-containing protein n=1 Tax=Oerskovia merdavium TaxID=2762227 RepID=A0ABR8TU00_9CELL|nr:carboxypeptidase regulatory-like domain-containing protein [Oerskovia merdavium]
MPLPPRTRPAERRARRERLARRVGGRSLAAALALAVLLPTGAVAATDQVPAGSLAAQSAQVASSLSLSGRVVSPESQPVADVLVQVHDVADGTSPVGTWTSVDGTFSLAGLDPTTAYEVAVHDSTSMYLGGFVVSAGGESWLTRDRSSAQVFSETTALGDVRLEAPSTIQGNVLDSEGRAAAGTQVVASATDESLNALVGEDGTFVIERVSTRNDYVLSVSGQPGINTSQYLTLKDGTWITQGDLASATPVRGGTSDLTVRLRPSPRIDGTVHDADGMGIDGLYVQLLKSGSGEWAGSSPTLNYGKFAFDGLEIGADFVLFVSSYSDPRYLGGYVRVADDGTATLVPDVADATRVSTGTLDLDVTVGETGGFSGRLTGISGASEYHSFTLHSADGKIVGWPGQVAVDWGLGADGAYSLRSSTPGTYRIGVNRQSGISRYAATYFSATKARGASTAAKASPVLLTAGEITPDVDVELRTCASVSGKLTGWHPTAATVTVYDDENPDVATRQAIVAPDGTYSVTGLLPGRYHVAADYFSDSGPAVWGKVFLGGGATEPERTRLDVPRCAPVKGVNIEVPVPRLEATEAPAVSGTPVVGAELAVTPGAWTLEGAFEPSGPTTVRYQWLRDGKVVKGAKNATYVPVRADVGKSLSVQVTAELTGFRKGSVTSEGTARVVAVAPGS